MQAVAAQDSMIGGTLSEKYKIVRQIGRGGMGVVYEAEHIELGKRVAIKLMLEKYAQDGEAIARFKREALAASRIGNPHIIDIGDIGIAPDGRSFVVMELLIGSSLADLIEKTGPMPPWRAIHIMRQVLRAVGAAHSKNIIHRDLKPDNIFLVQQDDHHDFVKLLDFGISKMVDQAAEIAATRLTTTGMVMGTPLYMAPEQAMGVITDQTADIYALGVILYEMLAGKPPFDGATYPILVAKLLTCDPELLSDARPGLPASMVAAVHRALEKEPENRFPSCEAFAAALPAERVPSGIGLEQTMSSGEVAAVSKVANGANLRLGRSTKNTVPEVATKRSRLPIIIGALGAGLAVGSVALILMTRSSDTKPANPTFEPISDVTPRPIDDVKPKPLPVLPPGTPVGFLVVKSIPDGANVFVDNEAYGVTGNPPVQITVTATKHRIRLEKPGYMSIEQDTDIEPNVKNPMTIGLPKLDPSKVPLLNPNPTKINPIKPGHPNVNTNVKPLEHIEPIPPGGPVPVQPYPEQPKTVDKPVKPPQDKPVKPPQDKPVIKPTGPASKPNPYQ